MWWRILVPTWRFFDSIGIRPELFVRAGGEWVAAIKRPKLHWYSLLFNPDYNRFHACNNLLERLVLELADDQAVKELISYRLVEDLVRETGHSEFKVTIQGHDVLLGAVSA